MSDFPDFPSLASLKGSNPVLTPEPPAYVPVTLATLNLEEALLEQYNTARKLIHDASYNDDIALNQKAQAVNSCTAILAAIIKGQQDLHNVERVKAIESTLIKTLRGFPELQAAFMASYSAAIKALGDVQ